MIIQPRSCTVTVVGVCLLALAGTVVTPGMAQAQVCIGNPSLPGQFTAGGTIEFADGLTGYGAGFGANLNSPFSVSGQIGIIDLDDAHTNIRTFGVGSAYALRTEGFGACPTVGMLYATWSDRLDGIDIDVSSLSFPVGFGIGVEVGGGESVSLIPSGTAGLFYQRVRVSLSDEVDRITDTGSKTEFFLSAGATVAFGQLFVRAGVTVTTMQDSDSVLSISAGLRF